MNKAQWKALYDIAEIYGCSNTDILNDLKESGAIDRDTKIEHLNKYVTGTSYDDMFKFLEEHI